MGERWLITSSLLQSQTIMSFTFGPEGLEKHPLSASQNGKYFLFDELYSKMKSNDTTVPLEESKPGLMK